METINLNLIPSGTNPVVHCSQYDEGRVFRFNLFDGSNVFTLDGTETIECGIKKPDGNIVTVAVTNTSDSYIDIVTTEQMCACGGNSFGTIKISKGDDNIYTLNFTLYCEPSPYENGIQSDSAIHNLESMVDEMVAEDVAEQYDSANVIFDNEPTENHGIGYTVTSEGIKTAIDNAFDYDNTASGSIVHIEDGADNLPVKSLTSEIVAVQSGSGTPSPSNPRAISGFSQANIGDISDATNITFFKGVLEGTYGFVDLGSLNWNKDTTTRPADSETIHAFFASIPNIKRIPITDIGNVLVFGYDVDTVSNVDYGGGNRVKDKIIGGGDNNSRFWIYNSVYNEYTTAQFKTAMSGVYLIYELATPTTPTITETQFNTLLTAFGIDGSLHTFTFGQTVYGGHFDNKGNLVSDFANDRLDSKSWTYNSGRGAFNTIFSGKNQARFTEMICSCYANGGQVYSASDIASKPDKAFYTQANSDTVFIKDSDYTDPTTWLNALGSNTLCYPLTTPTSLTLTSQDIPTLLGENNIFSNCGDVEVTYYTNKANDILDFINSEIDKKNGTNIPIEENSQDSIKDYIDNGLSGKADTSDLNDKQNSNVLNIVKHYDTGTSSDAITDIITEYGKVNMVFAFDVPLGYFTGCLTFANDNMGSGFIVLSTTGRFWVVSYVSGTITLTELT